MALTQVTSAGLKDGEIVNADLHSAASVALSKLASTGALGSAVTATTQSASDDSTKIATTAFVQAAVTSLIDGAPGSLNTLNELAAAINDDSSYATTLTTALATKAPLASPTFTGTVTSSYLTLSAVNPNITFTDTNENPDFRITVNSGEFSIEDLTNSATRFKIKSDGFLEHYGSASFVGAGHNYLRIGSTNAGGATLTLDGDSNGDGSGEDYCMIKHATDGSLKIIADNPANAANIIFYSNSTTERLRITSDGNVKIGDATTDYTYKLTVSGNASVNTGLFMYDGSAGTWFGIQTQAANGLVVLRADARSGAYPPLTFNVGGSERLRINSSGHLILSPSGYSLPTGDERTLNIVASGTKPASLGFQRASSLGGSTCGWTNELQSNGDLLWGVHNVGEKLRLTSGGRLGIGVTNPPQALSVFGNIYQRAGDVITWNNGDCQIGGVSGYHFVISTYTGSSMTEKLRVTSGGQIKHSLGHSSGNSAHVDTSWYGDDANEYTLEHRDFNEIYALKTANANNYASYVYRRETMTSWCDIEFELMGGTPTSYRHLGFAINGDGSDTSGNFDRLVFRSRTGNSSLNQVRLDTSSGEGFNSTSSSVPQWFDGTWRHVLLQIRGDEYGVTVDGVRKFSFTSSYAAARASGYFGFTIYEASTDDNCWVKLKNFKIRNYSKEWASPQLSSAGHNDAIQVMHDTNNKWGKMIGKRIHNTSSASSKNVDILNINSWQSPNSRIIVKVNVMAISPVAEIGFFAYGSAYCRRGGSNTTAQSHNVNTMSLEHRFGNSSAYGSLDWNGMVLRYQTPAVAYLDMHVDVEYHGYDGVVVTFPTKYIVAS